MSNRLDDFWSALDHEGAAAPIGIEIFRPQMEVEDLLHAWSRERGHCIEMGMVLEQSRRMIARLIAAEGLSREDKKKARMLLAVIRTTLENVDSQES